MANLPLIAGRVFNTPLLIEPTRAAIVLRVLERHFGAPIIGIRDAAPPLPPEQMRMRVEQKKQEAEAKSGNGVAVISVVGELVKRGDSLDAASGLTAYSYVRALFDRAMAMEEVGGILLDIDSPGGEAGGVKELADHIRAASGSKPVWAVANDSAFSAAYWIASAANRVLVTPTGGVGSIGVYAAHVDISGWEKKEGIAVTEITAGEHKADFSPHKPLADGPKAWLQALVNDHYDLFASAVAKFRGLPEQAVKDTEAALFMGRDAVDAKLADGIATFDEALASFAEHLRQRAGAPTRAASAAPSVTGSKGENAMSEQTKQADSNAAETTTTTAQIPAPAPQSGGNVVDLNAARAEGEAAALARVQEVMELCELAGMPHMAKGFIEAKTSPAEVRKALQAEKAKATEATTVSSHVDPTASVGGSANVQAEWARAFAAANPKNVRA